MQLFVRSLPSRLDRPVRAPPDDAAVEREIVDGATAPAPFAPAGLAYGYNTYDLLTLATLAHVCAAAFDDGPADP